MAPLLLLSSLRWPLAAAAGALIALRGVRKGSLSRTGGLAAALVGTLSLGTTLAFGITLLAFYFSGSAFTRWRADAKKRFDADARGGGGHRGAAQVLCTAGVGAAICVLYLLQTAGTDAGACVSADISDRELRLLILGYLGAFATVCGDTWASELGIMSPQPPFLITAPWRGPVPRGTNGGVSSFGLLCSLAGGGFVGVVALATTALAQLLTAPGEPGALHDPWACRWSVQALLVPICAAAGLGGSVLDSVIGATLQASYFEPASGRAAVEVPEGGRLVAGVRFEPAMLLLVEQQEGGTGTSGGKSPAAAAGKPWAAGQWLRVSGLPLLSNEAVNLLSSALTAALTALAGDVLLQAALAP